MSTVYLNIATSSANAMGQYLEVNYYVEILILISIGIIVALEVYRRL